MCLRCVCVPCGPADLMLADASDLPESDLTGMVFFEGCGCQQAQSVFYGSGLRGVGLKQAVFCVAVP